MSNLIRTQIYLPVKLKSRLKQRAKERDWPFSRIIIQFLEDHLEEHREKSGNGARSLLRMAERAKEENAKGPSDLAINHDYYLYGEGSPEFGKKKKTK